MNRRLLFVAPALLVNRSIAQTNFPEIEPNSVKAEATVVSGISPGDTITGFTTGASATPGITTNATMDVFRVRTSALPLGIYRHRLALTTATITGHTGTIRGLNQTGTPGIGGIVGTTDTQIQASVTTSSPPRFNQWYGFGKQEEIYYRVAGSGTTTAEYTSTMSTTVVSPTVLSQPFESGSPITITTVGQTTVDTEMMLFDATLAAIPGALNDDEGPAGPTLQSRLTRTLAPGTYYLAIAGFNLATNQPSPSDEDFVTGPVMDFADCVVGSNSSTGTSDLDFQIIAANGAVNQSNQVSPANVFNVTWIQFSTAAGAPTITTLFCGGDGSVVACPCANSGTPGNGCASAMFAAGAHLAASGIAGASNGTDTLVLTATNIPGPGLFFQASGFIVPVGLGDGLLCAGLGIIRLGMGMPSVGTATFPNISDPTPIHTAGSTQSGDTRHYQTWYRTVPSLCGAGNYNLTQGVSLTWTP